MARLLLASDIGPDFDTLELAETSGGCCLRTLFPELLRRDGLLDGAWAEELGLAPHLPQLHAFLGELEANYGTNPYHNAAHGADVLLGTHHFLAALPPITPLAHLAALFAAAIHDYAHPGTSNAYESKVDSPLALRYHDQSVLESHHLASAFTLLLRAEHNFLAHWPRERYMHFRRLVIKLVMMTDLAKHFDFISMLKAAYPEAGGGSAPDESTLLVAAIKTADLGHPLKPWAQHERWSQAVQEEFFLLGDRERAAGLPLSPLCCRERDGDLPRSQIGFIDFICAPLTTEIARVFPHTSDRLQRLDANRAEWARRARASRET